MTAFTETVPVRDAARCWAASLELDLAVRDGTTRVVGRRQRGPLALQRPLYPEGAVAHLYLLHPPGGVVGGDSLDIRLRADAGAACLATTPGATKFYRGNGFTARQSQMLVLDGGSVEWLPQENIFFDGAVVDLNTDIRIGDRSSLFCWEMNCFGRPASGAWFESGRLSSEMRVRLGDRLLLLERFRLAPCEGTGTGATGLRGYSIQATLLVYPAQQTALDAARALIDEVEFPCGATLLGPLMVLRCLGDDAEAVRAILVSVWRELRPPCNGRDAVVPRIWLT